MNVYHNVVWLKLAKDKKGAGAKLPLELGGFVRGPANCYEIQGIQAIESLGGAQTEKKDHGTRHRARSRFIPRFDTAWRLPMEKGRRVQSADVGLLRLPEAF